MIDIDVSDAMRQPGEWKTFSYEGTPQFDELMFAAPMLLSAEYGSFDDAIRVKGSFEASVRANCTRCLQETSYQIDAGFDEIFESRAGNDDSYTYNRETKRVSLDQMVYDLLQTEAPMRILCSDSCRGLCPVCGANLNAGPCGCAAGERDGSECEVKPDNPFAKLKDVF